MTEALSIASTQDLLQLVNPPWDARLRVPFLACRLRSPEQNKMQELRQSCFNAWTIKARLIASSNDPANATQNTNTNTNTIMKMGCYTFPPIVHCFTYTQDVLVTGCYGNR